MRRAAGGALALGALLGGCAAPRSYNAPATAGRSAPASASPEGRSVVAASSGGFAPPPPAPTSERPVVDSQGAPRADTDASPAPARPASATAQGVDAPTLDMVPGGARDEEGQREARIGAQVQRIREEQIRLATNPGVCHDVCFAAGSICLAAQEVCRLTGDADARCGRARDACADAGRQRDGACPVCPPTR